MGDWKGWLLFAAGVALSVVAWRIRHRQENPAIGGERIGALIGSVVLGIGCALATYPLDERTHILGFPFPAAVFERRPSGGWNDYIGLQTLLFFWINAAIGSNLGYAAGCRLAARFSASRERQTG